LHILIASSEVVPFAKTGGLADVAGALPGALARMGHRVSVVTPYYRRTREGGFPVKPAGVDLRVPVGGQVLPGRVLRGAMPGSKATVYFVDAPELYDRAELYGIPKGDYADNATRFIFFSRAVLELARTLRPAPDVIHANDWQSGLVPVYLKSLYRDVRAAGEGTGCLFTVHNLAYGGLFWHYDMELTGLPWMLFNWRQLEFHGKLGLLKGGLVFADSINTVSPRYAEEIQTEEFGCGLEGVLAERKADLFGVINGIDYSHWSPEKDKLLPARYSAGKLAGKARCKAALQKLYGLPARKDVPLVGLVGRLAEQKGVDILTEALGGELLERDLQFVLLGTGNAKYHALLEKLGKKYPKKAGIRIAFDNKIAHLIEAGSDMFLMPSRYEPCGLNQLISLRYGTVPVVRATGGLADTITDATADPKEGNGFSFEPYTAEALADAVTRALALYSDKRAWRRLVLRGMKQDWSWDRSAREYVALYERCATRARSGSARLAPVPAKPKRKAAKPKSSAAAGVRKSRARTSRGAAKRKRRRS